MNEISLIEPEAGPGADLVAMNALTPETAFAPGAIDGLLERIEREARAVKLDVSTAKGRKAIASLALKIARSKTTLDGMGKNLTDQFRKQAEAIHAERRTVIARLDALKEEIRKPLTDFEAREAARIAEHEEALRSMDLLCWFDGSWTVEEVDRRSAELETIHVGRNWQEFADRAAKARANAAESLAISRQTLIEGEARAAEEARIRAEREAAAEAERVRLQTEREARIAAETEARVKREAEKEAARVEEERVEAARQAAAALAAAEERAAQAERDAAVAARQAEADRIRGEENARQEERRKLALATAASQAGADRRAADKAHRARINTEILRKLVELGVDDPIARTVIGAIATGKVPNVTIAY